MVKDLLIGSPPDWNKKLIEDTFIPFEGIQIQQLPLTDKENQDSLMWMFSETGVYSVKTGYQAIQCWKNNRDQGPSSEEIMKTVWKKVWGLQTIPRHKVLIWKIINRALPVRSELINRGIRCSLLCPRCDSTIETINHLFLNCEHTRREWFGSQLGINFQNENLTDFIDWLISFILNNDKSTIITMAALLYSVWHARNQLVFKNKDIHGEVVIQRAKNSILSYKNVQQADLDHLNNIDSTRSMHRAQVPTKVKWVRPEKDVIKVNSDVNLSYPDSWGIGVIARNDEGLVMASGTWMRLGFHCAGTAEAWGLYQAVHFAHECGFNKVQFESDNERLIKLLQGSGGELPNYLGARQQLFFFSY
ncbi:uncharacterized protein [Medicago truncatula]|nr:uncharacterized protein LOC112422173 [Medicago truncatula]